MEFEARLDAVLEEAGMSAGGMSAAYVNGVEAVPVTLTSSGKRATMLGPVHMKAIALHVAGMSRADIADIVQRSVEWVSATVNHPDAVLWKQRLGDQMIRETLADARGIVQSYVGEAAMTVVGLMRGAKSEVVRLRASETLLDRGGVPKTEVTQQTSLLLRSEDVSSIRSALAVMNEPLPVLEDVDVSHTALAKAVGQPE